MINIILFLQQVLKLIKYNYSGINIKYLSGYYVSTCNKNRPLRGWGELNIQNSLATPLNKTTSVCFKQQFKNCDISIHKIFTSFDYTRGQEFCWNMLRYSSLSTVHLYQKIEKCDLYFTLLALYLILRIFFINFKIVFSLY